jgi:hypothetical protein
MQIVFRLIFMITQVVPVIPVSKIEVAQETLAKVGFSMSWQHNPGQNLMYAEFTHPDGISVHASESRGDGIGPVVVYFRVSNVDELAAQAGTSAEDQTWHMREFWLRDSDGNSYRFGQPTSN